MITAILIIIIFLLVRIASICNKLMDKWMIEYLNLPEREKQKTNPSWYSFDPTAKWDNGKYGTVRDYNKLLLKIHIKTKWAADNCNDGWHFMKFIMIFCLCSAMVIGIIIGPSIGYMPWWWYTLFVFALGFSWNSMFNTFK